MIWRQRCIFFKSSKFRVFFIIFFIFRKNNGVVSLSWYSYRNACSIKKELGIIIVYITFFFSFLSFIWNVTSIPQYRYKYIKHLMSVRRHYTVVMDTKYHCRFYKWKLLTRYLFISLLWTCSISAVGSTYICVIIIFLYRN